MSDVVFRLASSFNVVLFYFVVSTCDRYALNIYILTLVFIRTCHAISRLTQCLTLRYPISSLSVPFPRQLPVFSTANRVKVNHSGTFNVCLVQQPLIIGEFSQVQPMHFFPFLSDLSVSNATLALFLVAQVRQFS